MSWWWRGSGSKLIKKEANNMRGVLTERQDVEARVAESGEGCGMNMRMRPAASRNSKGGWSGTEEDRRSPPRGPRLSSTPSRLY